MVYPSAKWKQLAIQIMVAVDFLKAYDSALLKASLLYVGLLLPYVSLLSVMVGLVLFCVGGGLVLDVVWETAGRASLTIAEYGAQN